ncbi:hypothetical protein [Nannocystis pusilla]|uniref:Lipoprotein n=1 Tax=Nannocystis pusilla TaxID=889268 RepID=A0ABS7U3N3_9BACT|nr:hypothetical protein [Nannocystis pusilla]MBZ5715068.1 hypothetical protein [Nannocystis pusilla]
MNTFNRMFFATGLVAFGLGMSSTSGCGGGDYCSTVFNKAVECASPEEKALVEGLKDLVMKDCREKKDRDPEEEKADLECAKKSACDEYKKCQQELSDKKQAIRIKKEVEGALKTGEKMEDALSSCKYSDIKDEEVKKLCADLFKKSIDAATKELEGIRDSGGDGLSKCFDLQATAEKVSPEEKTKADALCKEVEAGKRAKEALDEAKKNLDGGTNEVPFQCSMAVEDLEKLTSDWAKNKLQEVAKGCYVDLGKKILPAQVDKMVICEYQVEQVYKAVNKYNLKDAELDGWITKADAKCAGSK